MNIIKQYATNNPYYKENEKKTDSRYVAFQKNGPQGLMLHSVGCAQPKASVFVSKFNSATYDAACVHAFIDANDGNVYQIMPWTYRAPHCGGSANNTHIGIEMCEPAGISYGGGATFTVTDKTSAVAAAKRTFNAAVELFASLCTEYKLDPMKDIISHNEGYQLGVASGHVDPEHLWKGLGLSYTMDTFRAAVKAKMAGAKVNEDTGVPESTSKKTTSTELYRVRKRWSDATTQIGAYANLTSAKKTADANKGYYVFDSNGTIVYPKEDAGKTEAQKVEVHTFTAKQAAMVYCDTQQTICVGHLNNGESCHCIEAGSTLLLVWYVLDSEPGWKAGYVSRSLGDVV